MSQLFGRVAAACLLLAAGNFPAEAQQAERADADLYGDPLPSGATARLGTTRFRHKASWGRGLALTPDGTMLFAASDSHSLYCWDTATGRLVREIDVEPMHIRGFALSRDGKQIAAAGFWYSEDRTKIERQVRILDAATGRTVRTLERSDSDLDRHEMAFSPDGKLLISLGTAGILRIEELASGVEILQEKFPRDVNPNFALSPDGSTLAIGTGANTRKFYLWKWQNGEPPRELKIAGTDRSYSELTFSPDGKQLAASLDFGDQAIHIWDVGEGKLVRRLSLTEPRTHVRGNIVYTPDGQTVAMPGYQNDSSTPVAIHFWNPTTGEYQGRMDAAGGRLAMSADGRLLAAGGDSEVRVWKWPTREEVAATENAHRGSVGRIAVTKQGEVVTASDDGSIRVWNPATQQQRLKLQHRYWVRDIAVSPDGSLLASSALDDTVRLWDLASGREIYRLPGHGRLGGTRAVGFSADGQSFGSFGDDCYLRIWDVRTGKALVENKIRPTGVKVPEEDGERDEAFDFFHIDQARFSPDASLFLLSIGKHFVFQSNTGKELRAIENRGSHITALAVSPANRYLLGSAWGKQVEVKLADGRTLHTTEKKHPVTLWDLASGQVVKEILLEESAGPVAFSADGERFAVSSRQPTGKVTIYSTATGDEIQSLDLPEGCQCLCFTPDGRSLVTGQTDSTALVWKLSAAK